MKYRIRMASQTDADAISQLIVSALRTSNARDYSPQVIERVTQSFSPAAVKVLMSGRLMYVAEHEGQIVGTAGLDGRAVRSVFVDPGWHRQGVGRQLMAQIEQTAREAGIDMLVVPSSLTAHAFYQALGFTTVREQLEGEERTLIMERDLRP